jgi:Mlc titration factor MtfA (ptsG expression regulator)
MIGLIILIAAIIIGIAIYADSKRRRQAFRLPDNTRQLLLDNVTFYSNLNANDQRLFEARIKDFLSYVTVRGIDVEIDDLDRLLVASSAIILIFSFPDWRYNNISEVLLYKGAFTRDFGTEGPDRNILGMVGEGALHRVMILSKPSLRASFQNSHDGQHTPLHEFAHLLDKADGAVDGVPEYLLSQAQSLPWIKKVQETIRTMRADGHSDIDLYGATNDAEFFAVITEYFFERPQQLKEHHPELYELLEQMFHPKKP